MGSLDDTGYIATIIASDSDICLDTLLINAAMVQNAAKIKRDEHSQLEEIINTLREKLEVQNGNEN